MALLGLLNKETLVRPRLASRLNRVLAIGVIGAGLCAAPVRAQQKTDTIPAYRNRILGIFDVLTGQPIEGVLVKDILNKTSSLTTKTGTVGLFFLPDGGAFVSIT